jgi:hypothetical protein
VEYCAGVPAAVVPDQLKAAVTGPCRYEPTIQRTFEEWAAHYGTVIVPARPGHPRDKAKVEAGVLVAERWILARLRHQRFFSLAELNARIAELGSGRSSHCTARDQVAILPSGTVADRRRASAALSGSSNRPRPERRTEAAADPTRPGRWRAA